jgi:hypothetical protein
MAMKRQAINVIRATLSIALAVCVGGCWTGVYQDPMAQYIHRSDTITLSAGNAEHINRTTQVIDPWPRGVNNRRIPGNGSRLTRAVERYQSGPGSPDQSQAGTQVIGIPVGAATPSISGGQPPTGAAPQ